MRKVDFIIFFLLFTITLSGQNIQSSKWNLENNSNSIYKGLSNTKITYKGGLVLEANDKDKFGGLSALWVSNDGKKIVAISDYSSKQNFNTENRSRWFLFDLYYDENQNLINADINKKGQFLDFEKKVISGEIESLAWNHNTLYISFDEGNKLFSYDINCIRSGEKLCTPIGTFELDNFPKRHNAGIEALTLTRENHLLAIYEKNTGQESREAWLLNPVTGSTKNIIYIASLEDIKGATTLQNGDILILEKTYDDKTIFRLSLVAKDSLNKQTIETDEIFTSPKSKALDNFEGIASYSKNGKEYLFIISDDNGDRNKDQKTLLFHFELNLNKTK